MMTSTQAQQTQKVVLAYSGGLDTTTIIPWLKENYDVEVIAVAIDLGLGTPEELAAMKKRALESGASDVRILDVRDEFMSEYVFPCLKAGAVYEQHYLLGTAMARPLIAKKLVEVAQEVDAGIICHGATGKGNDQVRFEVSIKALAPTIKIIAPWRLWNIRSREDALAYLDQKGIVYPAKKEETYSRDQNLWHLSHEGLELEDPGNAPNYDRLLQLSVAPQKALEQETVVDITFKKGLPTHVNGEALTPVEILKKLNTIGGQYGIGIVDMVENRVVGLKARGIYENPGGAILYRAHDLLEQLCLDAQTRSLKQMLAIKYSELVYGGQWFTPLREALDAFVDVTQQTVTGTVKLTLYKGNMMPAGIESPYSLYDQELASFTTGELYNHSDAEGFITLYGLPAKVRALMMANFPDEAELVAR